MQDDIDLYCNVMQEIKLRTEVMREFLQGKHDVCFVPAIIESVVLQLRKSLELIAVGSLLAKKKAYEHAYEDFSKHWKVAIILKNLARINPDFYPKPCEHKPTADSGFGELTDITKEYLTQKRFIFVYEKCGKLLHSNNPSWKQVNYQYYWDQLPEWIEWTMNLLATHQARMLNSKIIWLVNMHEDRDDQVHAYVLKEIKEPKWRQ